MRAFVDQGTNLVEFLDSLTARDFGCSVPPRTHTVHDTLAALFMSQNVLVTALDQPTSQRPSSLTDFLAGSGISRHRIGDVVREIALHETSGSLVTQFRHNHEEISRRLLDAQTPSSVMVHGAVLRTIDLLRILIMDWVISSDDLNRALPAHRPVALGRDAVAGSVRVLADILRRRHPGQSIEVRVPPFAAVQCGTPGEPKHTRGTPPTVIEVDGTHFLRLCRGRETWADAVRDGHVQASGVRSDISEWLPVL